MSTAKIDSPRSPFMDVSGRKVEARVPGSSSMKRSFQHASSSNLSVLEANSAFTCLSPTSNPPLKEMRTQFQFGKSPVSINSMESLRASPVPSFSFEAPARINCSPKACISRPRAFTLPENCEFDAFIQLEAAPDHLRGTDLPSLVARADQGLKQGVAPIMADGAMGGTYFLRDRSRMMCLVCKPGDEEPNSPNNPHQFSSTPGPWGASYKGRVMPGFGMYREVAAYELDQGFAGVPPTQLARLRHNSLRKLNTQPNEEWSSRGYKTCSVQSYVKHVCSTEDMGPSKFDVEDVMRIAIFDMRMCNLDRHEGNILVCSAHPYQENSEVQVRHAQALYVCTGSLDTEELQEQIFEMSSDDVDERQHSSHHETVEGSVSSADSRDRSLQYSRSAPASMDWWPVKESQVPSGRTVMCSTDDDEEMMLPPPPPSHCFSPAGIEQCKSSSSASSLSSSSTASKYRLVPIDHGYMLPHVLHISETSFAWLHWSQVKGRVPENLRRYIAALDVDADMEKLRKTVGAAIPETSLLTLKVCTTLLQKAVAAGVTLYDIASKAMCTGFADSFQDLRSVATRGSAEHMAAEQMHMHMQMRSALQIAVDEAIQMTIAQEQYHIFTRLCFRPSDLTRLTGALSFTPTPTPTPTPALAGGLHGATDESTFPLSTEILGVKNLHLGDEKGVPEETTEALTKEKDILSMMMQIPINEETLFKAMNVQGGKAFSMNLEAAIDSLVTRLVNASETKV